MAKKRKPPKRQSDDGLPLIVFMASLGGGILGYLAGEMAFYTRPHPVHWTVALGVALLGYLIGQIIYRQRGDII